MVERRADGDCVNFSVFDLGTPALCSYITTEKCLVLSQQLTSELLYYGAAPRAVRHLSYPPVSTMKLLLLRAYRATTTKCVSCTHEISLILQIIESSYLVYFASFSQKLTFPSFSFLFNNPAKYGNC